MVKIIMHGCNGAMGQVISSLAEKDEELEIAAGIDLNPEQKNGYPVFSSLEECTVQADVIVDFASAKAVDHLLDYCGQTGMPVVLCTTGPIAIYNILYTSEICKHYMAFFKMPSRENKSG